MEKLLGFLKVGEQRKKRSVMVKYKIDYLPVLSALCKHGYIYSVLRSNSNIHIFLKIPGVNINLFSKLSAKIKQAKYGRKTHDQLFAHFYGDLKKLRCQLKKI